MNILILGAGAIGIYIGGRLAEAGHRVTFIARPATAGVIRSEGVRLTLKGQEKTVRNVSVFTSPAQALALSGGAYDFIAFAPKSQATAAALAELRAAMSTPPPILCLQNGVDNEPEIVQTFGVERVIAGTVTTAVSRLSPGEIAVERERGVGVALRLSRDPARAERGTGRSGQALGHALSLKIAKALAGAGFRVRIYPTAGPMKWSKLLVNLIGNATSAILDLSTAELFADRRLFSIERAMLLECLAVMRALNHAVVDLPGVPVRLLVFAMERLPQFLAQPLVGRGVSAGRGAKRPSFHVDLHARGRETEVRWLNGAVARHGAELGVPTPVNHVLTQTLQALSAGRLSKEDFRRKPEALLRLING